MSEATLDESQSQEAQTTDVKEEQLITAKSAPKKPTAKSTPKKPAAKSAPKKPAAKKYDEGKETGTILDVPITSIVRYDNPRKEPESLYQVGFTLIGDPTIDEVGEVEDENDDDYGKPFYVKDGTRHVVDELTEDKFVSLAHAALNSDYAQYYVELIEEYEQVDRNKEPMAPQTIVELAEDITELGQLVPILVRKEKDGYAGIDGGRRIAAILYLHAKSLTGTGKKYPATVKATTDACKQGDMFLHSLKANLSRKDFTALQEGRVYHQMLQQANPATGKKWTMKDAAKELKIPYGTFRNREALWHDKDPNTGKGLTDAQREKVSSGEWGVTAAARKALGEKHYKDTPESSTNRNRALPLKEIYKLFDETAEARDERRKTLAQCMGLMKDEKDDKGFKQAVKESESRIEAQDEADMKRSRR